MLRPPFPAAGGGVEPPALGWEGLAALPGPSWLEACCWVSGGGDGERSSRLQAEEGQVLGPRSKGLNAKGNCYCWEFAGENGECNSFLRGRAGAEVQRLADASVACALVAPLAPTTPRDGEG